MPASCGRKTPTPPDPGSSNHGHCVPVRRTPGGGGCAWLLQVADCRPVTQSLIVNALHCIAAAQARRAVCTVLADSHQAKGIEGRRPATGTRKDTGTRARAGGETIGSWAWPSGSNRNRSIRWHVGLSNCGGGGGGAPPMCARASPCAHRVQQAAHCAPHVPRRLCCAGPIASCSGVPVRLRWGVAASIEQHASMPACREVSGCVVCPGVYRCLPPAECDCRSWPLGSGSGALEWQDRSARIHGDHHVPARNRGTEMVPWSHGPLAPHPTARPRPGRRPAARRDRQPLARLRPEECVRAGARPDAAPHAACGSGRSGERRASAAASRRRARPCSAGRRAARAACAAGTWGSRRYRGTGTAPG